MLSNKYTKSIKNLSIYKITDNAQDQKFKE